MKVRIVGKREDVKEMTIEELIKHEYIGLLYGGKRLALECRGVVYSFYRVDYGNWDRNSMGRSMLIRKAAQDENVSLYVFKTDKLLYLWMAE